MPAAKVMRPDISPGEISCTSWVPRSRYGRSITAVRPPALAELATGYGELYDALAAALERDPLVRSVELGGSLARGDADRWSDLDLVVDAAKGFDAVGLVRRATPTDLLRVLPFGIVAVTPDWLRLDLVVRGTSVEVPPRDTSLQALVEEFLRVLGLLPVIVGRREWIVGCEGAMLLRSLFVTLLLSERGEPPQTGVKRLNEQLTDAQRELVEALPPLAGTRESVVDAHGAVASLLLDRARRAGSEWPIAFERATRHHLGANSGSSCPISAP